MRIATIVTFCLALTGCAGWCAEALAPYTIGSGDSLEIEVGGEDALSGLFEVSSEGTIVYPLLGSLRVDGLTAVDLTELIRTRLGAGYLVSPQVVAYVKGYASKKVAVLGDVPTPGFFVLKADSSLLSLLSEAGLKLDGADATIIITRPPDAASTDVEPAVPQVIKLEKLMNPWQEQESVGLSNGDRIFVKTGGRGRVIVSGKVKKPGVILLEEGLTVLEAVNRAGGLADFANQSKVRIVRETPQGSEVLTVDLSAIVGGDRSKDLTLKDGDIIDVPRRLF